ncbi:MAG TPA: TPM domain-containing protein [Candidatus Omnitrophota bacterium]|nr:TPM domain-containing protein [Candidatus Omnitrophota bacterium]
MPRIFKVITLSLLVVAAFASRLFAFDIPPRADGYVTDRAGLLSPSARVELEAKLRTFDQQTSTQIAVAIFPSLEGGSLEDISMRIAETWKPGQKDRDNGVLLLVFRDDRKIRIEVGYGLEGVLTDVVSGQIIRQEIAPCFRRGNYASGVEAGVDAIMLAVRGEFKAKKSSGDGRQTAALVFIILLIVLPPLLRKGSGGDDRRGRRRGGFFYTGTGYRSGGSRGGFGGFSGGSFGGGGASGGW